MRTAGRYVHRNRPGAARTVNLLVYLTRRHLWARYRGSALGFAWSQLNPLLLMLVYSAVFRLVLRMEIPGTPYPVFFLTGLLAWNAFRTGTSNASTSILDGAPLVHKASFPRFVLPLAAVLSNGANLMLAMPLLVLFNGLFGVWPDGGAVWWLPAMAIGAMATAGLGMALAATTAHFRDTTQILESVFTAWFFATPVLYPLELARENLSPTAFAFYRANPAVGFVVAIRGAFLGRPVDAESVAISAVGAFLLCLFGVALFHRLRHTFAECC